MKQKLFLYKVSCCDKFYKENFFCGIFSIQFNLLEAKVFYKFLNTTLVERTFRRGFSCYKLFRFIKFKRSLQHTRKFLMKALIEYVKNQTLQKDFQLIHFITRLGETYLQLHHFEEYFQNKNIKNPIFISQFRNLASVCNMFFPNIKFIAIPPVFFEMVFSETDFCEFKGYRYFLPITRKHLINVEEQANNNCKVLFYNELKKTLGVNSDIIRQPKISQKEQTKSIQIVKQLRLEKKLVYIIPDAQSNSSMSLNFWETLCCLLKENYNFDVFLNTKPIGMKNQYKHKPLTIEQVKNIALKADIIIGIRCGLMDLVANNNSSIFAIYQPFNNRAPEFPYLSAEKVLTTFSLKQLPNINNKHIYEYNAEIHSEEHILNEILNVISNKYEGEKHEFNKN